MGKSFVTQDKKAVPASLVYLPYYSAHDHTELSIQMSPGTACHDDYDRAQVLAVLECIERDAFTLFWEAGIHFPLISHTQVNLFLSNKGIHLLHAQIYCMDITTDLDIPVVLTLILSTNHRPPFVSLGIAAAIEFSDALDKSLSEAITSWRSSYEIALNTVCEINEVLEKLTKQPNFMLHAMYHCLMDIRLYIYQLLSNCHVSTRTISCSSIRNKINSSQALHILITKFSELSYDATLIDITSDDIKDFGLYVIRAISFDLVRPSLGFTYRHLNNKRFTEVPQKLGLTCQRNTIQDIMAFRVPSL